MKKRDSSIKTVFLFLLAGLSFSTLAAAGIKIIPIPVADTQKPIIRKQIVVQNKRVFHLLDTTVKPLSKISSATELKLQVNNLEPSMVKASEKNPLHSNIGNTAYKSGDGVVLTGLNPIHNTTKSTLYVYNVVFSNTVMYYIHKNLPFQLSQIVYCLESSIQGKNFISIQASFRDLPTGHHTYLLTLGTSANVDQIKISIENGNKQNSAQFEKDNLVANPSNSEIRLLFSYDDIVKGPDGFYCLWVTIEYKTKNSSGYLVKFDHLQLVQLD